MLHAVVPYVIIKVTSVDGYWAEQHISALHLKHLGSYNKYQEPIE